MKITIGEEWRSPFDPAPKLMFLWAVAWSVADIARLIDGPGLAVYSAGEVSFGALQYAETIAGLLVAIGVGWAGLRLEWGARTRVAVAALAAFVLHRALISLHWGGSAWLQVGIASGVLQDVFCAAALAWFIYATSAVPDPDDRRIPRVVDLALLILVGRDALRLVAPPVRFDALDRLPGLLSMSPVETVYGLAGMLLGAGVLALVLARGGGARVIAPATSAVLSMSLLYVFVGMGAGIGMLDESIAGFATRASLYAMAIAHMIERGILMSAIKGDEE